MLDTLKYAKRLQQAGFTEQQAEAQAGALWEAIEDSVATKQDIQLVRQELREMETRSDHKFELVHQKIELARRDTIIWLVGMIVVATAALGVLMKVL